MHGFQVGWRGRGVFDRHRFRGDLEFSSVSRVRSIEDSRFRSDFLEHGQPFVGQIHFVDVFWNGDGRSGGDLNGNGLGGGRRFRCGRIRRHVERGEFFTLRDILAGTDSRGEAFRQSRCAGGGQVGIGKAGGALETAAQLRESFGAALIAAFGVKLF